jgi:hypothetical protein
MWRLLIVAGLVGLAGCFAQVQNLIDPSSSEPVAAGALSCREIIETCDSACTDPMCLHRCTAQGTAEAQPQHDALLTCGQRNGCVDEVCMRTSCPVELEACGVPPVAAEG